MIANIALGLGPLGDGIIHVGSVASLILLVAFWHPWIVVGVVVDLGLLALTFALPDWWTRLLT